MVMLEVGVTLLIPVGYVYLLYDSSKKVSSQSGFGPCTSTVI